jgi:hypothetical protein
MKVMVKADGERPLTVILEPYGMEYELQPADHFVFEWVDEKRPLQGVFAHTPTTLTITAEDTARMWDSRGNEMSMFG